MRRALVSLMLLAACKEEAKEQKTATQDAAVAKSTTQVVQTEEAKTREQTLIALRAMPSWLPSLDVCPSEVMPKEIVMTPYDEGHCKDEKLVWCAQRCASGDAQACFAMGVEVQVNPSQPDELSQRIFLRACMLGEAGGCTMRIQGRLKSRNLELDECTVSSFKRTCDADDAWGCAMLASALSQGGERDQMFAAINKACTIAPDRAPCESAKKVRETIENADRAYIEKKLLNK